MSVVVLALVMSAALADAQTKIKSGFNLFSPQQDVEVGQQSATAAEQQLPILRDSAVQSYVDRVGQKLAANAGGPDFQYRFRVVNASDINAFALPGGYIYVNRGVLDQARNEGEVAGVLAHEISHVALRHGTHQASKAYLAQAGIGILGGILGGKVSQGTANIINAVGGIGLNALFLKYSRDLETQADVRGAQILAASGYSPGDMVGFFQTLERVDTAHKTNWLSDHPAPPDRIARIQQEARLLHVSESPTTNVAGLQSVQSRLRGFGAAPTSQQIAQGVTSTTTTRRRTTQPGNASSTINIEAPSSTLRSYTSRSGVYRISFPSNWQVYEQGNTGVTIAPPGAVLQSDVVTGAIINHYDPFGNGRGLVGGSAIDDATNDLLATLQQSSPYLRVASGSGQRVRMANGTALAATLRGVDPATGIDERVTVVTRQLADDHLIYMLFITPERDAGRYSSVLNAMVNSMQINTGRAH
jgi:Zn-dependent protease with chaperone function